MLPAERRDVFEQVIRQVPSRSSHLRDSAVEVDRIPMHDCTDNKVEARGTECLASNDRSRISPRS